MRCGRYAYPPTADHLLPPVFPGPDQAEPCLYPANTTVPCTQQAEDLVLLQRRRACERNRCRRKKRPDEFTRFKGLGEISPDEFKHFIGKDIRLDPVTMKKEDLVKDMLEFYMGKNTMERQNFIIDNLVVEEDVIN